ncbi:MAG TPA: hypothetical protein VFK02_11535 [Kofleriaceae bacterium]|nr:hypothetical protein [Kofleriaceae bacterium]
MADAPVVRFHYIKSSAFRVVHADGVVGGPTPSGLIHLSFFSERLPIPTIVDHAASDAGGGRLMLGEEIAKEGKEGVVREVEVGVVMTIDMAKKLHMWLGDNIQRIETAVRGDDTGGPDAG